jgi:hypothetical protein
VFGAPATADDRGVSWTHAASFGSVVADMPSPGGE